MTSAVLLVAHGSSDPRAAATTRALARAVAAQRPGLDVRSAFLDHAGPRPDEVLFAFSRSGHRSAVVVPLLLTAAYHGRVDLPAVLDRARSDGLRLDVSVTDVLGPVAGAVSPLLLASLRRALPAGLQHDGIALVAAGTRDDLARHTVDQAASALGATLGVPCQAGFASGSPVTGAVAVSRLREAGCSRIAIASYFLAPGRLHDMAVSSALSAGALAPAAPPLGSNLDLARLVVARIAAVSPVSAALTAA
ncbi:sirohydrochlorin chelatase [Dactylosporangium fulvum]|uniref:Cobalamin biosynthesis protein CbiX n=1 Tax=Dactylosporangium fulvum TaxID=53359 RepID=A0ABY5W3I5_9ACTN|nr:CbiX/SirB N-terminal domain-containing protein [Dactylosporangium fulvum]UWP83794.1 cobalamin biosynthesis protein CbiX [Dactylosporangium fulvum]